MAYIYGVIGAMADTSRALDSSDLQGYAFGLGDIAFGSDGSAWVFCQAAAGITDAGYVVGIDENYQATMLSASAGGDLGDLVGVAATAVAQDEYFWAQRLGASNIQVAASAAANTVLAATATAGQLDAATGKTVTGAVLTTANGGSAGAAPGILNWPVVGDTTT